MEKPTAKSVNMAAREILNKNHLSFLNVSLICIASAIFVAAFCDLIHLVAPNTASIFLQGICLLVFGIFFVTPLGLGLIRFFWKSSYSESAVFADFLYYFSSRIRYFRAVRFSLIFIFRVGTIAFFCYLPLIIVSLLNVSWIYMLFETTPPVWAAGLTYVFGYLNFFCSLIFIFSVLKLYLSPVLIVTDDNMTSLEALHISSLLSSDFLPSFVKLLFRNLIYFLLNIFIVPAIYTVPHLTTCYIVHAKAVFDCHNAKMRSVPENLYF